MSVFLRRMAVSMTAVVAGLVLLMVGLEKLMIDHHGAVSARATSDVAPELVVFFAGFAVVNLGVFTALSWWARFSRSNPGIRQAPVSVLVLVVALLGGGAIAVMAHHADRMRAMAPGSVELSWPYVVTMVGLGTLMLLTLVFIAVRWSPGYHRRLGQILPEDYTTTAESTS